MKIYFIVLSILASVLTWWWHSRPRPAVRNNPRPLRRLTRSLVAGVVTYFGLMALAMVWLLLTT